MNVVVADCDDDEIDVYVDVDVDIDDDEDDARALVLCVHVLIKGSRFWAAACLGARTTNPLYL